LSGQSAQARFERESGEKLIPTKKTEPLFQTEHPDPESRDHGGSRLKKRKCKGFWRKDPPFNVQLTAGHGKGETRGGKATGLRVKIREHPVPLVRCKPTEKKKNQVVTIVFCKNWV